MASRPLGSAEREMPTGARAALVVARAATLPELPAVEDALVGALLRNASGFVSLPSAFRAALRRCLQPYATGLCPMLLKSIALCPTPVSGLDA